MNNDVPYVGAVEAGGTKVICAVGTGPHDIQAQARIATGTPEETWPQVLAFFAEHGPVAAVGLASFGPVELRADHPDYGHLTATPKPGWSGFDLVGPLVKTLKVPVGFDTDVSAAALGEWRWGSGQGLRNLVYFTVGTGIGGGLVIDGHPVPGLVHAEMGHMVVSRQEDDNFTGCCPFHGDCFEGMASGPAIEARWGRAAADLGELQEQAIDLEARIIASGLRNVVYLAAPQRIIVGGGVSGLPGLLPAVNRYLVESLAGYMVHPEHQAEYVVAPTFAASGVAGAFALAQAQRSSLPV